MHSVLKEESLEEAGKADRKLFLEGAGCGWPWFITGKEHGYSSVQRVLEGLMPSHMEGTFPDRVSDGIRQFHTGKATPGLHALIQ